MKRSATTRHAEKRIETAYRKWASPMAFCVATGSTECELVHLRHHTGMGRKPPPWHTLPLCRALHTLQETDKGFFPSIGIKEPFAEASHLFELWQRDDATAWAIRLGEIHDMTAPHRADIAAMIRRAA